LFCLLLASCWCFAWFTVQLADGGDMFLWNVGAISTDYTSYIPEDKDLQFSTFLLKCSYIQVKPRPTGFVWGVDSITGCLFWRLFSLYFFGMAVIHENMAGPPKIDKVSLLTVPPKSKHRIMNALQDLVCLCAWRARLCARLCVCVCVRAHIQYGFCTWGCARVSVNWICKSVSWVCLFVTLFCAFHVSTSKLPWLLLLVEDCTVVTCATDEMRRNDKVDSGFCSKLNCTAKLSLINKGSSTNMSLNTMPAIHCHNGIINRSLHRSAKLIFS
jgi:hypothetical protein